MNTEKENTEYQPEIEISKISKMFVFIYSRLNTGKDTIVKPETGITITLQNKLTECIQNKIWMRNTTNLSRCFREIATAQSVDAKID